MRALVLGSGVSGLTCALRLLEAGFAVEIQGREPPLATTSNVAAALWYPYQAGPAHKVDAWARRSYAVFRELAREEASGVLMRSGLDLFPDPRAAPALLRDLPGFRPAQASELRGGYAAGFVLEAPVIEMPVYLAWLAGRVRAAGGVIVERACASLDEALAAAPVVVNATGLGARELADDRELYPIRGQVVRVERAGVEQFLLDDHGPRGITYVIPRTHDCVLGGTSEPGREDLEVDTATSAAILARCRALEPRLADAKVLGATVGLRPGRPEVRLAAERRAGGLLVHDYGHGGAGVTLSWGCAEEVRDLVLAGMKR